MCATLVAYFILLSVIAARTQGSADNDAFFRADRRAPWPMVAFGMIGASISGVSLISVPAWVAATGMTYLQMCMGFIVGYAAVAFLLLPVYYRLRLTSIYAYLGSTFGARTQRAGAFFFILSKLTGAAARLYLVVVVVTAFLPWHFTGIEVALSLLLLLLIYLYTRRGGIRTIVRTDALQTACMLLALGGILWAAASALQLDLEGVMAYISESPMSKVFEWDGGNKQAFWRQFLSGIFIVIVMTGLDQDMMQKNLTCRTLREAQKNMCAYGLAFLPINFLLLALGVLLYGVCQLSGLTPPASPDALLPSLVSSGALGAWVVVPFTIGIVAAAFSSADSALTALTTSFCIDILRLEDRNLTASQAESLRRRTHIGMFVAFLLCMCLFRLAQSQSMIDLIYRMASYTYGPLLGLYAYALLHSFRAKHPFSTSASSISISQDSLLPPSSSSLFSIRQDRLVPYAAIISPILCASLDLLAPRYLHYTFGYELLLLNGLLTYAALSLISSLPTRTP